MHISLIRVKSPSISGPNWDPHNKWLSELCCDWQMGVLESLEYYSVVFYEKALLGGVKHSRKNWALWVLINNICPVSLYSLLCATVWHASFPLLVFLSFLVYLFFWELLFLPVLECQLAKLESESRTRCLWIWLAQKLTKRITKVERFVLR